MCPVKREAHQNRANFRPVLQLISTQQPPPRARGQEIVELQCISGCFGRAVTVQVTLCYGVANAGLADLAKPHLPAGHPDRWWKQSTRLYGDCYKIGGTFTQYPSP